MLAGESQVIPSPPILVAPGAETTELHTRILRLALDIEDSRRYWEHFDPSIPVADRPRVAFEGRWDDQLKLRGCVFFPLCKTQTWTRVR